MPSEDLTPVERPETAQRFLGREAAQLAILADWLMGIADEPWSEESRRGVAVQLLDLSARLQRRAHVMPPADAG